MKVIGAGLGRTGTMSLKAALERLGAGPCFHMIDLIREQTRVAMWEAAVEGRAVDWHEVFDGYEATVDWPGCSFYRSLMEAFPDAKVLLTVRDPEAWYESTLRTIHAAQGAARSGELEGGTQAPPSPAVMRVIAPLIWDGEFEGRFEDRDFAIGVFNRHNEDVRRTVPAERLLVHEISDGWEPLAQLLGVEAPDEAFPRLNDTASFRAMVGMPALPG
ncbi:sulfotransferase family protein [Candidatus Solirubrobacter pratensis]|uniref:sulfotransferase family protein n=1 Tax=Candidatus Solirubrobacter pratensis TaxID=1298857 RepID=UPI0004296CE0|nr:sulfotransferase family protein [Candidatus Solirubrobacter pratensis]